jgi:hypothetical protein
MKNLNKDEFHIPFIRNLILVAILTIVSMASVHFFLIKSFPQHHITPSYTSQESQIVPK